MTRKKRVAALDATLRRMFTTLEERRAPEHITLVVDLLEEAGEALDPSTTVAMSGIKTPVESSTS